MSRELFRRSRRNGTRSKFAGDEPRNRELGEHWPKKIKRHRFPLSKSAMERKRKEKLNKHADMAAYEARLAAPWPLYVAAKKGGD